MDRVHRVNKNIGRGRSNLSGKKFDQLSGRHCKRYRLNVYLPIERIHCTSFRVSCCFHKDVNSSFLLWIQFYRRTLLAVSTDREVELLLRLSFSERAIWSICTVSCSLMGMISNQYSRYLSVNYNLVSNVEILNRICNHLIYFFCEGIDVSRKRTRLMLLREYR